MSGYCKNCYELQEQLDQLKAENDTLRQFLSKEPLALQALQSAYSSYKKSTDVFYKMVKQYKQTIAEIKEIAERDKGFCGKCDGDIEIDCVDCNECGIALLAKEILQKISEVGNE